MLQYHFGWKTLSAMAGLTWLRFYFRLFPGAIKSPQAIEFLEHLLRHIPGRLLIIWDGLAVHRSRAVRAFAAAQHGRIELHPLPAYAPELNPTEYIWGHLKHHEIPNFCPRDLAQLSQTALRCLRRMRRRPNLVAAFWRQAGLFEASL